MNNDKLNHIDPSYIHFYSYGRVVEDNKGTRVIKVYPVEKICRLNEIITEDGSPKVKTDKDLEVKTRKVTLETTDEPDYIASKEKMEFETTTYLTATWASNDGNRITPPDVSIGETVLIYRMSNMDLYFWEVFNSNKALRKAEDVVYLFKDNPDVETDKHDETIGEEDIDIEDHYYIRVSPLTKTIKIHTGSKFGEYTTYDLEVKTKDGYIELIDGIGNQWKLDSAYNKHNMHIEGSETQYDIETDGNNGFIELKDSKGNSWKLDSKEEKMITTTNNAIEEKTTDKTITLDNKLDVILKTLSIQNDSNELISVLIELVNFIIEEKHIDENGILTSLDGGSVSNYNTIIEKLNSFKG